MEDHLEQSLLLKHGPDTFSTESRVKIVKMIKKSIFKTFPTWAIKIEEYGSFPLRTYLKSGDIDITIIAQEIPFIDFQCYLLTTLQHHFEYIQHLKANYLIQDILFVQAEVPILKMKINKVSIDLTVNQVKGINTVVLFEEINKKTLSNLLKRSITIAKI